MWSRKKKYALYFFFVKKDAKEEGFGAFKNEDEEPRGGVAGNQELVRRIPNVNDKEREKERDTKRQRRRKKKETRKNQKKNDTGKGKKEREKEKERKRK